MKKNYAKIISTEFFTCKGGTQAQASPKYARVLKWSRNHNGLS